MFQFGLGFWFSFCLFAFGVFFCSVLGFFLGSDLETFLNLNEKLNSCNDVFPLFQLAAISSNGIYSKADSFQLYNLYMQKHLHIQFPSTSLFGQSAFQSILTIKTYLSAV